MAGNADQQQATAQLEIALHRAGIDHYVSVDLIKQWIYDLPDDDSNSLPFLTMLTGLVGEVEEADLKALVDATMTFYNLQPQKRLGNKSPNQMVIEKSEEVGKHVSLNVTQLCDPHIHTLYKNGMDALQEGNGEEANNYFDQVFAEMFAQQTTSPLLYRMLANKALAKFLQGGEEIGEALINAALKLNPKYDFAQKILKEYQSGALDWMIEKGKLEAMAERSKWSAQYDVRRIRYWKAEKILATFRHYNVTLTKKQFVAEAKKVVEIDALTKMLIDPYFVSNNEYERDFIWMGAKTLWRQWCPQYPCVDIAMDNLTELEDHENEASSYDAAMQATQELLTTMQVATTAFFVAWKKYMEYHTQILSFLTFLAANRDLFEQKDIAGLENALLKSNDQYVGLIAVGRAIAENRDFEQLLKRVTDAMPYNPLPYIFVQGVMAEYATDPEQELQYLQLALETNKSLHEHRDSQDQNLVRHVYDVFIHVYDKLITFYSRRDDKKMVKKYTRELEKVDEKEAEYTFFRNKDGLSIDEVIKKWDQERIDQDPAMHYLRFLEPFGINFSTEELTETPIISMPLQKIASGQTRSTVANATEYAPSEKVGRNDPCTCGSGKKYKKCCYLLIN